MLTNVIHRWRDIVPLYCGQIVLPHFIDLHTSNSCNHNCKGCAFKDIIDDQYMSEKDHFKAVDTFIDHGVAAFDFAGGGEPCKLPYIRKLLKHIHKRNANYAMITNGSLIDDVLAEILVNSATYVRISLEASSAKDYARYKQVPAAMWDRVFANVKKLVSIRGRHDVPQISLKFSVGRSLRGIYHYQRMIDIAEMLEVDRVYVKALRHEPEELAADYRKAEEQTLKELIAEKNVESKFFYWIAPADKDKIPQCWLCTFHTVMDHKGNIYLCCYYYFREKSHYIGNVLKEPFNKIWFSDEHKKKITDIDKNQCAKVDCKFFKHHWAVEDSLKRGRVYWL